MTFECDKEALIRLKSGCAKKDAYHNRDAYLREAETFQCVTLSYFKLHGNADSIIKAINMPISGVRRRPR